MTISSLTLTNLTAAPLSIDLELAPDRQIRELLAVGGSFDASGIATPDELNRNSVFQAMLAAGLVSVKIVAPATSQTDIAGSPGALLGRSGAPALDFITGSTLSVGGIPQNKVVTGRNLLQGQTFATGTSGTGTSSVAVSAKRPGTPGNLISLVFVDAAAASVSVSPATVTGERTTASVITVNYRGPLNGNVDNANAVAALINGNADATRLVVATGGGTGNFLAGSLALTGGTGAGFKVFVGGGEAAINVLLTNTSMQLATLADAASGLVNGNATMLRVISNGVESNALACTVVA